MDITFIKTCKNPYYNKMPIDELKKGKYILKVVKIH